MSEWQLDRGFRQHHFRCGNNNHTTGNVSGQRRLRDRASHQRQSVIAKLNLGALWRLKVFNL